ncbi:hypothetical protein PNA2_0525 [Pyrococcus sp. NA2]|uniref:hypothetical protein n=1 Tax=Pyrococcus sp. (strain NA2) TaxID=342949 RepID=UPI000209AB38|nr:hypothetical protein [Pyrococcus sp. NA2]AEC51442.1 hypothetical protein PNA2_0525 [Pyrococcus sp. NA2]
MIGVIFAIPLGILTFLAFVGYNMVTPPKKVGEWTPRDLGLEYKDIEFKSRDGIKLRGWWIDRGRKLYKFHCVSLCVGVCRGEVAHAEAGC